MEYPERWRQEGLLPAPDLLQSGVRPGRGPDAGVGHLHGPAGQAGGEDRSRDHLPPLLLSPPG